MVPLRVLFGRSGAGKSTILDGIAAAVSGYPSLARGRSARGMAGVLLKDSEHVQVLGLLDTILDALKRKKSGFEEEALIEEVDALLDRFEAEKVLEDEWIVDLVESVADRDHRAETLIGLETERVMALVPDRNRLDDWTVAAFLGDGIRQIPEYSYEGEDLTDIAYPEGRLDAAFETKVLDLLGIAYTSHLVDPSHIPLAVNLLTAILGSEWLLLDGSGQIQIMIDREKLSRDTQEAIEVLGKVGGDVFSRESWVKHLAATSLVLPSLLYMVASSMCNGKGRFLRTGQTVQVDRLQEFCGYGGSTHTFDEWRPRVVNLGGDVEQSVAEFAGGLTRGLPLLHDRLLGQLIDWQSERGRNEAEARIIESGLLAPMAVSRNQKRQGQEDGPDRDRWLLATPDGVQVRPTVEACCQILSHRTNELMPDFLLAHGEVQVQVRPIPEWTQPDAPRLSVSLVQGETSIPLERVGSGIRRWMATIIDWAFQDLIGSRLVLEEDGQPPATRAQLTREEKAELSGRILEMEFRGPTSPGLLIIDEPELHLDQRLQLDIAEWLKGVSRQGTSVVLASHSPAFLTYPEHEAVLTGVVLESGAITTIDMTSSLLEWCEEFGQLVGLSSADTILLASGFIVVEGPHDSDVLRHFYGPELDAARIRLLHLMGTHGESALIDSEYLVSLGKPMGILLDKIKRDRHTIMTKNENNLTNEERSLKRMWSGLERRGVYAEGAGHPFPDIMCALPEDAVRRAYPKATFSGWSELEGRYKKARSENFKSFALREMGLKVNATKFIQRVLKHCGEDAEPAKGLRKAMNQLLAHLTTNPGHATEL